MRLILVMHASAVEPIHPTSAAINFMRNNVVIIPEVGKVQHICCTCSFVYYGTPLFLSRLLSNFQNRHLMQSVY